MAHRGNSSYSVPAKGARSSSWANPPEPLVLMRAPAPKQVSFGRDLANGLLLGDFAREKRMGGALVQIVCSFTPGVGTLCALRDCVADARYRDGLGFFLNLLALIPVFGGVSKTLDVLRGLWHARHVMRSRKRHPARQAQPYYVPVSAVPTQRLPPPARPSSLPPARPAQTARPAQLQSDPSWRIPPPPPRR